MGFRDLKITKFKLKKFKMKNVEEELSQINYQLKPQVLH